MKCPICGSEHYGKINPPTGDSFVITTVDSATKTFNATSGTLVDLYGCADCKNITLRAEYLSWNQG